MREQTRQQYLQALGIQQWELRVPSAVTVQAEPVEVAKHDVPVDVSVDDTLAQADWETLQRRVADCTLCDLHRSRTQTVFGVGNRSAAVLFIGEAPGADEDRAGEPFVGRAGKLLNEMLFAIGLQREQIYIANILKCRPPNNRDPADEEVACCEPYLMRQLALIQPQLVVALGRVAAQNLLKTSAPLGKLRGQMHQDILPVPLLVTYHPAYLLRSPLEKRKAWQDLMAIKKFTGEAPGS